MRDAFPGHYPLTSSELDRIWNSATVVLDTNVLLNPYRYSVGLREKFTQILMEISSRLWVPHQVALEFHDRRLEVIQGQHDLAKDLDSGFEHAFKQAKEKLHLYKKNALLDVEALESRIDEFYETLKKGIVDDHSEALGRYAVTPQDDPMLGVLAEILGGRVGAPYPADEFEKIKAEADGRFERKVPPGYKDLGKTGDRLYGDFVIWKQIMDYAKENKVDVLLVTDDAKEDWWWRSNGMTLGPRPELRQEFISETNQIFYAYRSGKFISEMSNRRAAPLEDGLLAEVENASKRAASQILDREREREAAIRRHAIINANVAESEIDELKRHIAHTNYKILTMREDAKTARDDLASKRSELHALLDGAVEMDQRLKRAMRDRDENKVEELNIKYNTMLARIAEIESSESSIQELLARIEGKQAALVERKAFLQDRARRHLNHYEAAAREMRNPSIVQIFDDENEV